ncbi:hypothetical protein JVT61DRAFT_13934 [Boletus reticuloceps]|uniref:Uncharacterized protein n=1 Tax=Boletus reticuloceps TaxID=495285 RepID=A0A8I3AAM1_9AGAM|nr:hypothetical protein JVT61DRAFT_13934 [Boletus reticuloceps]
MGWPKIHHTPEERELAAREYRAKYYKRHSTEINKKARIKRMHRASRTPKKAASVQHSRRYDTSAEFEVAVSNLIGPSLHSFTERLCQEYLATSNYASLNECTTTLGRLEKNLLDARMEHFQCGYHRNSYFLQAELDRVRTVSRAIEDMLCHAMEGNNVADLHSCGLLRYQSVPD